MKLIIDIPDEVLKSRHYCQYFGAWSTKLTETIENGIPYEERPQGEWICKTKSTFPQYQPDEYKCPFCGHIENRKTKFCCDCGTDMRGETDG
jgi:hypothetical protein